MIGERKKIRSSERKKPMIYDVIIEEAGKILIDILKRTNLNKAIFFTKVLLDMQMA